VGGIRFPDRHASGGVASGGAEYPGVIPGDSKLDARALHAARLYHATLPEVERGGLRRISLHWSATPYGWARERASHGLALPYNVVVDRSAPGEEQLVTGMSAAVNARELSLDLAANVDYCASVRGRNSHGVAASISAMAGARPSAFGDAPIDAAQVEFLCAAAGALCAKYGIDARAAEACYTHAEAALWDGYFGTGDDERWDLCVLEPTNAGGDALAALAPRTGDRLRARIAAYAAELQSG
jgi:hypothetical protein